MEFIRKHPLLFFDFTGLDQVSLVLLSLSFSIPTFYYQVRNNTKKNYTSTTTTTTTTTTTNNNNKDNKEKKKIQTKSSPHPPASEIIFRALSLFADVNQPSF